MSTKPASPYKGLNAFEDTELDALLFFGRERETEIVVANLIASRLTVLYGPSGVGKSSLLGAAVARSLRELPEEPLVVVFSQWSADPAMALSEAVAEAAGVANGSMVGALEAAQAERDVYLVLDQAEEYFLYHADDGGSGSFAESLPAVLGAPLRVNVLVSLRDDALARLDRFTGRIPGLFANTLRLDRLDRPAARAAILRPAERYSELVGEPVSVEPGLVELVLEEVGAGQIEPSLGGVGAVGSMELDARVEAPYLQLVMQRLWEEERVAGSTTLRVATLERLGGARWIVEEHLESALADLSPAQEDVAGRLFNHLVTPSGTKIAHAVSDLAEFGRVPIAEVMPVLEILADRRILRSVDEGGVKRYEIFHDVLAQPVLAWRTRHRTDREIERQVAERAQRKSRTQRLLGLAIGLLALVVAVAVFAIAQQKNADEKSRDAQARRLDASAVALVTEDPELGLLLARESARLAPGPTAEDALLQSLLSSRVRATYEVDAPADAVAFAPNPPSVVYVGRNGELTVIDVDDAHSSVLGNVSAGSTALYSRGNSFIVVREPAASPRVIDGRSGRHRCVLTGVGGAAADAAPAGEYVIVVRNGVGSVWSASTCERLRQLGRVGTTAVRIVVSPDGKRAAFLSGREARVVAVPSGKTRYRLRHPGEITALAFNGDGSRIVTGGRDRLARIWNGRTGRRLSELTGHSGQVLDVAFSPLGTQVATASTDGTARIWNAETGQLEAPLFGHTDFVRTVDFSPDGQSVATSSDDGTARTWALNGRRLATFAGHSARVSDARFLDDGAVVATVSEDGTVRIWDTGSEPDLGSTDIDPPSPPMTTATRDGMTATADGTNVRLERGDGSTQDLEGHRLAVTALGFSPDGARLVTASRDSDAILWDASSGSVLRRLRGHFGEVSDARFSPDGRWIVTAGPRSVGLWRASDGRLIKLLAGPAGPFVAAEFQADSRTVVARTEDGTVVAYDCRLCAGIPELLELADERLGATGRQLSAEELELYLGR